MSDREVIETFYSAHAKYEVVKSSGSWWSGTHYYIRKNGKPHKGPYDKLCDAVRAAKVESGN